MPNETLKLYLISIGNISVLTREEEIALFKKIKQGDKRSRDTMIEHNLKLVVNSAKRHNLLGIGVDPMDIVSLGNLGLCKAIDKFDPKKGFRFSTYADWWIYQEIMRGLGPMLNPMHIPEYINQHAAEYRRELHKARQLGKGRPQPAQMAKRMKIDPYVAKELDYITSTAIISIDKPVSEGCHLSEAIPAEERSSVNLRLAYEDIVAKINVTLREKKIMEGLLKGRTLGKIGLDMDISRERVRQLKEKFLKKIRKAIALNNKGVVTKNNPRI